MTFKLYQAKNFLVSKEQDDAFATLSDKSKTQEVT